MKVFTLLLSLFFTALSLNAQTYQVIKVAGIITNCESGDTLRISDIIEATDLLCFMNTDDEYAVAAVIDLESKSRHLIKAETSDTGIQKGLLEDRLVQSRSLTGTRKGKINTIFDMRTLLGNEDFLILGGELALEVNPSTLAMNVDSFFFASYEYNGTTINKKLEPKDSLLVLNASELFKIDNVPICMENVSEISLYYYRPKIKKKELVTTFHPVFPFSTEIKKELNVITQNIKEETNTSTLKDELIAYLVEVYGKADEDNLKRWLDAYLSEDFSRN